MTISYAPTDLIADNPTWSYADFELRSLQISAKFKQDNIRSIALWLEDGAHLACILLAAWHAGTRVLLVPNLMPESVQWGNENASLWITEIEINQPNTFYFKDFAAEINLQEIDRSLPLIDRNNQTEFWLKTSGSSGEAKTIIKTARQMWLSAEASAQALPFASDNEITAISSVSIQHIYGLTIHIMMSLVLGWRLGRHQQHFPEYIIAQSHKTQKTVLISSPAMLTRINWEHSQLPNAAGIISSGGALAEDISNQIRNVLNQPVVEIYGSTETGPIASRSDAGLWHVMPNAQIGTDEQGALWLEAAWTDSREQTADAVDIFDNGFALLGRIDRIVKLGDKRTSLVSVEQDLVKHQWVDDAYISKHPAEQRLAAWVGLTSSGIEALRDKGRKYVSEQLKDFLSKTQEKSALPRFWRFCDKLPRNSQSKISRLEFEKICLQPQTDPLWSERQKMDNSLILKGKVPLDLIYFKGHFNQFPLVPGVIELQWVVDSCKELLQREINVQRVDNLKFQKFLRPGDEIELMLRWEEVKNRVVFQLKSNNDMCGSGIIITHG